MKIVLIGIPGAGKSTQGNLLSKQLGIPYLSTGHIFRNIAKEKTQLGRYVKETMTGGHLIPDDQTLPIVEEYLSRKEYARGYILDGFPRTVNQAKQFQNGIDKVVYIKLPDKEALWRIAFRTGEERDDQSISALTKRVEIFHEVTKPVTDFYKKLGKLEVIDGTKSVVGVNKDILKSLGKQIIKNQVHEWEQKKKIILAITGLAGSGKTEAVEFFKTKKIPTISFSEIVTSHIRKHGLQDNEKDNDMIRMQYRTQYGMASQAILSRKKIGIALGQSPVVVIEHMMSFEEFEYLKEEFPDVEIKIICVWADKRQRYNRVGKRAERNKVGGESRDLNEILKANKGPTMAFADYMIVNESSLEDLYSKLENVFREVYFTTK